MDRGSVCTTLGSSVCYKETRVSPRIPSNPSRIVDEIRVADTGGLAAGCINNRIDVNGRCGTSQPYAGLLRIYKADDLARIVDSLRARLISGKCVEGSVVEEPSIAVDVVTHDLIAMVEPKPLEIAAHISGDI